MVLYPADEYDLVGFRKAKKANKKIEAILRSKKNGEMRYVAFGQKGSETFKNDTGVKIDKIHGDDERRKRYRLRHAGEGAESRKWSPGYFSWWYSW